MAWSEPPTHLCHEPSSSVFQTRWRLVRAHCPCLTYAAVAAAASAARGPGLSPRDSCAHRHIVRVTPASQCARLSWDSGSKEGVLGHAARNTGRYNFILQLDKQINAWILLFLQHKGILVESLNATLHSALSHSQLSHSPPPLHLSSSIS